MSDRFRIVHLNGMYQVQYPYRYPFQSQEKWYPCCKWWEGPDANFGTAEEAEAFVTQALLKRGHGRIHKEYGK